MLDLDPGDLLGLESSISHQVSIPAEIFSENNSSDLLRMASYILNADHNRFTPELKQNILDFYIAIIRERHEPKLKEDEYGKKQIAA